MTKNLDLSNYRSRATAGRSQLVAAPLRFQVTNKGTKHNFRIVSVAFNGMDTVVSYFSQDILAVATV